MSKKQHKEFLDWQNINIPGNDLQTDLSTANLLEHISINEAIPQVPKGTEAISASEIINAHTRDIVRIEIQRKLYNRIAVAIKKANSRLSVPAFIETILDKVLQQENL